MPVGYRRRRYSQRRPNPPRPHRSAPRLRDVFQGTAPQDAPQGAGLCPCASWCAIGPGCGPYSGKTENSGLVLGRKWAASWPCRRHDRTRLPQRTLHHCGAIGSASGWRNPHPQKRSDLGHDGNAVPHHQERCIRRKSQRGWYSQTQKIPCAAQHRPQYPNRADTVPAWAKTRAGAKSDAPNL